MDKIKHEIHSLNYLGVIYLRLGGRFYTQFRLDKELAYKYDLTSEIIFSHIIFFDNYILFKGKGNIVIKKTNLINPKYDNMLAIPKFLYDFELPFLIIDSKTGIIGHILFFDEKVFEELHSLGVGIHDRK